jgi:hypothetical protein
MYLSVYFEIILYDIKYLLRAKLIIKKLIQFKVVLYAKGSTSNHKNYYFFHYFCDNHQSKWVPIPWFHRLVAYLHFTFSIINKAFKLLSYLKFCTVLLFWMSLVKISLKVVHILFSFCQKKVLIFFWIPFFQFQWGYYQSIRKGRK